MGAGWRNDEADGGSRPRPRLLFSSSQLQKPQLLPSTKTAVNMRRTHWPAAVNSLLSCCLFLRVSVIECLERSCSNVRVEGPVFQAFIDSRCFGAGWPPLPEARPRWVARKRERRPAAKLLARRSPRPRAVHHRHLYFHLNAQRSSLKPTLRHKRWNIWLLLKHANTCSGF